MSGLESALAAENDLILQRLPRGRTSNDRSLSPKGNLRSTSRGRSYGNSGDRRGTSRARSQGEDDNYKWSILFHDPSERFINEADLKDGEEEEDDVSEEEQVSDGDEDDFDHDINDLILPNYRLSINDYYKFRNSIGLLNKESLTISSSDKTSATSKTQAAATKIVNKASQNLGLSRSTSNKSNDEDQLREQGRQLEEMSQALALGKGLEDAKDLGSNISEETLLEASKRFSNAGINGDRLSVGEMVKLENAKDQEYEEYKKILIDESKTNDKTKNKITDKESDIVRSAVDVNSESLRASRAITLGNFFEPGLKDESISSYLLYMDLSTDSINTLQYTLGTVVKSGDVLYVINSANDETKVEFFKQQVEKLTEFCFTYLNLIKLNTPDFKLHIVIESLNQVYPKHFLNELIKYLKPKLLIVSYKLIIGGGILNNYISNIPLMIVKRKARLSEAAKLRKKKRQQQVQH